jgi:hypothetical protein
MFLAWIGALATTAPAGSETVPVMVPRSLCANVVRAQTNTESATKSERMRVSPSNLEKSAFPDAAPNNGKQRTVETTLAEYTPGPESCQAWSAFFGMRPAARENLVHHYSEELYQPVSGVFLIVTLSW